MENWRDEWFVQPDNGMNRLPFGTELVRLHLELVRRDEDACPGSEANEELRSAEAEETRRVLQTFGEVRYGDTISRDVIVPGDMPLWALHYAIQRCFGWQNSHLHQFQLPEKQFRNVTNGVWKHFTDLVGVVFRSPWMDEEEEFWNDDYEDGSFKAWLRRKYTGPYDSLCHGEGIWQCKQDMKEMKKRLAYVEAEHWVSEDGRDAYRSLKPISAGTYRKRREEGTAEAREEDWYGTRATVRREVFRFSELPMDGMRWLSERPLNQLLERLTVEEVLALHEKGIDDVMFEGDRVPECFEEFMVEELQYDSKEYQKEDAPDLQPCIGVLTDTLYYYYDFGDDWCVKITGSLGAADLVESGRVTREELEEAVGTVCAKHRPVCIAQDGLPVLDDVGGLSGFVQFLRGINQPGRTTNTESDDDWSEEYGMFGDKQESLAWAKSLGWSKRKTSCRNLL